MSLTQIAASNVNLKGDVVLDEQVLSWSSWFEDLPLAEKQLWVAQLASLLAGLQAYPYPAGRAGNLGVESPRANMQLLRAALAHALSLLRSLHYAARHAENVKSSGVFPHAQVHRVLYNLDQWLNDHLELTSALINLNPTGDHTLRAWCRTLRATLRQNETLDQLCAILKLQNAARSSELLVDGWTVFGDGQIADPFFDDILSSMDRAILWFRSASSFCRTQTTPALCYLPIAAAVVETRHVVRSLANRHRFAGAAAQQLDRDFFERWEADFLATLQQALPPTPTQPQHQEILATVPFACAQATKLLDVFRNQMFEEVFSVRRQPQYSDEAFRQTLIADLWVFSNILRAFADVLGVSAARPVMETLAQARLQEFLANVERYQHLLNELDLPHKNSILRALEVLKLGSAAVGINGAELVKALLGCGDYLTAKLGALEATLPASVSYETKVEALARFCAGMPVHRSHSGTPVPANVLT